MGSIALGYPLSMLVRQMEDMFFALGFCADPPILLIGSLSTIPDSGLQEMSTRHQERLATETAEQPIIDGGGQ